MLPPLLVRDVQCEFGEPDSFHGAPPASLQRMRAVATKAFSAAQGLAVAWLISFQACARLVATIRARRREKGKLTQLLGKEGIISLQPCASLGADDPTACGERLRFP